MSISILAVDNDPWVLMSMKMFFQDGGVQVQTATSGAEAIAIFSQDPKKYSVVLLDYEMKSKNGFGINGDEVARQLKAIRKDAKIVMVSGTESPEVVSACLEAGAEKFVLKGEASTKLLEVVRSILFEGEDTCPTDTVAEREEKIKRILKMVGRSKELAKVSDLIEKFAPYDEPLLIQGESGVGKEAIARAGHDHSKRRTKPFLAVNCTNFSKELLESELFGYERGSFTGAVGKKIGLLEQANGGTVFLDEIGDMPLELQAKILRALQEKTIQPVGGVSKRVDFRVIAATHRNLRSAAQKGEFRHDLYYRLKYLTVDVPPLRERPEDVEPLVNHFLKEMSTKAQIEKGISDVALKMLKNHKWPGNVRDLEGVVKKAFVLANRKITPDLIAKELEEDAFARIGFMQAHEGVMPYGDFIKLVEEAERGLIQRAMQITGNVKRAAAEFLGMNNTTLDYRRTKLGMDDASRGSRRGAK